MSDCKCDNCTKKLTTKNCALVISGCGGKKIVPVNSMQFVFKTNDASFVRINDERNIPFYSHTITGVTTWAEMKTWFEDNFCDCVGGSQTINQNESISHFQYCRISDGAIVLVEAKLDDEGNVVYTDLQSGLDISDIIGTAYEICQEETYKEFKQTILVEDPNNKKQTLPFWMWQTIPTGEICYTSIGDDPNADASTVIDNFLTTYTMASNVLGAVPVIKSDLKTKKGRTIEVCGGAAGRTVTLADLAAISAAELAALTAKIAPETGYEWAVLGLEVNQHPAKKKIYCDLADEEGMVTAMDQASYAFGADSKQYVTVGDSKDAIIKMLPNADACGCLADRTCLILDADFTTPITLEPNTGIELCIVYVCVVVA